VRLTGQSEDRARGGRWTHRSRRSLRVVYAAARARPEGRCPRAWRRD
jgi:hypothetical protein